VASLAVILSASAIGGVVTRPVTAQTYGRWWWDAQLRSRYRFSEVLDDVQRLSSYHEKGLQLDLGLNGYLGHPVLGSFRIGLSGGSFDYPLAGREGSKSSETGGRVELRLLPRGNYPLTLSIGQKSWNYPRSIATAERTESFLPSSARDLAAKLRFNSGPLVGTVVSHSRSKLDFADSSDPGDLFEESVLGWSRHLGPFDNLLRVRDALRQYGHLDYRLEDSLVHFEQRAVLGPRWSWALQASRVENRALITQEETSSFTDYRLSQQSIFDINERHQLNFNFGAGYQPADQGATRAWQAGAFYLWRVSPDLQLGPYFQYADASGQARASQVTTGLSLSDRAKTSRWDFSYSTRVGLGMQKQRQATLKTSEDRLAYSIQANAGRGAENRARLDFDLSAGRSQVDLERREFDVEGTVLAFPNAIGRDDFVRGTARLYRQRGAGRIGFSTEVDYRRTTPAQFGDRVDSQTVLGTVDFGLGTFSALLSAGSAAQRKVETDSRTEVRFASARASVRFRRYLSLTTSYRYDEREVAPSVSLTSGRLETDLTVVFGEWSLSARAWDNRDELTGGNQRELRGFELSLARSVAGWLPIVTGGERRGSIR